MKNEGVLSDGILQPGQRVSIDLYQSTVRGRLPHTRGKESDDDKYCGGAIITDHATGLVFHKHQVGLTAMETIMSKHDFENFADEFAVKIREYVGDNHPFNSVDFKADCELQRQKLGFSGVGAHHQNKVERTQLTIMNMARTMMMHFVLNWPEAAEADLWPFAIDYAVWLWNNVPKKGLRMSPLELFTSCTFESHRHLQRTHVFGCPVYVLDPKLQDGKKLPKWNKRSRQGVFLGFL
jgi:hypothetical protein